MEKTRDFFKKIRDTKRTFHAKFGTIKDRNGMYKTEAEDINKRWQDYTDALGYFLILQKNNVLYVSEAYHLNLSLGLMVSRIYDFL